MELDQSMKDEIKNETGPIIASSVAGALVAAAGMVVLGLLATNIKTSGLTGDKGIHPTDSDTSVSKSEIAATETEGKLAQDKVSAANGEVEASKTEAAAQDGGATAMESGATAARTKAGAADIETKGLKMT